MSDEAETYVMTDPITNETLERVVYTAADRVAAKFAGYTPRDQQRSSRRGAHKAAAGGTPTEKAHDSK
jgi:hypothetical protein